MFSRAQGLSQKQTREKIEKDHRKKKSKGGVEPHPKPIRTETSPRKGNMNKNAVTTRFKKSKDWGWVEPSEQYRGGGSSKGNKVG